MAGLTAAGAYVGREAELALLWRCLRQTLGGIGGLVFVSGEPGIGKTRLLEEWAATAADTGARLLWGRCHEDEGAPAYWPWTQVLRLLLAGVGADQSTAPDAAALRQIVPELAATSSEPPQPDTPDLDSARFRLFEAVSAVLCRAAERQPIVVALEDVQWADAASLQLLQSAARALVQARVLFVGSYRAHDTAVGQPLAAALSDLERLPSTHRLPLAGLDRDESAALAASAAGTALRPATADALYAETEGNPYFIRELVRLLQSEGRLASFSGGAVADLPRSIAELIGRRVQHLSAPAQRTLAIASVIGRGFTFGALARVAEAVAPELVATAVLDSLDEAMAAQIVQELPGAPGRYRFSHALTRTTVYSRLAARERIALHRQVALALEQGTIVNPAPYLSELAHHFLQAAPGGDLEKAVRYARLAAEQASSRLAWETAIELYRRALEVQELAAAPDIAVRCDLQLALAEALNAIPDRAAAKSAALQAAANARLLRDPHRLARAALAYALPLVTENHCDPTVAALLEGAIALFGNEDDLLHARAIERLARELLFLPDVERAETLNRAGIAMARRLGDPATLAYCLAGRLFAMPLPDRSAERLPAALELLQVAEAAGDPVMVGQAHYNCTVAFLGLGDGLHAAEHAHSMVSVTQSWHQPIYQLTAEALLATLALLRGELVARERAVDRAIEAGQLGDAPSFPGQLFVLRRERDRSQELLSLLRAFVARDPQVAAWRAALALVQLDLGHEAEARVALRTLIGRFDHLPHTIMRLPALVLFAELAAELADHESAAELYDLLRPFAAFVSNLEGFEVTCLGPVAFYLGRLAIALGRYGDALDQLAAALSLCNSLDSPAWAAHVRFAAAVAHARRGAAGDQTRSQALLDESVTAAQHLGMTRLARLAAAQQQAIARAEEPKPPLSVAPAQTHGLSGRELEVLRLLAAGETNSAIAARLVISPATVERHVFNIYRKIGARGRADATGYAVRQGLAGEAQR